MNKQWNASSQFPCGLKKIISLLYVEGLFQQLSQVNFILDAFSRQFDK